MKKMNRMPLFGVQSESVKKTAMAVGTAVEKGKLTAAELAKLLYWRNPPTIKEFLTAPYVGALEKMLYPKWRQALTDEIFHPGSSINEIVLTGSIGCGKTTVGLLAQYYNLMRVLCYRRPQFIFGVPESSVLAIVFVSIMKEKAVMSLFETFKSMLATSAYFHKMKKRDMDLASHKLNDPDEKIPYIESNNYLMFPNKIMVYTGSSTGHTLSMNLIGAVLDEAEFRKKGANEALDLYATIKERMRNRFLDRRNLLLTLISSVNQEHGIIQQYVDSLDYDDPYVKVYSYPVWEVKTFDSYKKGSFYVFCGTKRTPSRILEKGEEKEFSNGKMPKGCKVIKVPVVYKKDFESNILRALRNLAGVATDEREALIDNVDCFEHYDKLLLPELQVETSLSSPRELITHLTDLFETVPGVGVRLKRAPNAPRYIHHDLAATTEAGIAMVHKEYDKDSRTVYVVDFVMKLTSKDRIDIEKVQSLGYALVKTYGISLGAYCADQYQSEQLLQYATKHDFAKVVDTFSVVRKIEPYLNLATVVNKSLLRIGKAKELENQLVAMQLDEVDDLITSARKDMADAICGAVNLAMEDTWDEPQYQYEVLSKVKSTKVVEKKGASKVHDLEEV